MGLFYHEGRERHETTPSALPSIVICWARPNFAGVGPLGAYWYKDQEKGHDLYWSPPDFAPGDRIVDGGKVSHIWLPMTYDLC